MNDAADGLLEEPAVAPTDLFNMLSIYLQLGELAFHSFITNSGWGEIGQTFSRVKTNLLKN